MELKLPKIDLDFLKQKKRPLHVAINGSSIEGWAEKHGKEEKDAIKKHIEQIKTFMNYQIKNELPILTLHISVDTDEEIAELTKLFQELITNEDIHKKKVRVFIIGRWFDLETDLTDAFKKVMEETKDYDNLFLNFCVKYDGQEEVLGVIKLLATKAKLGKLNLEELKIEIVKENLYTSYFTPPEIIIEPSKVYSGLLLWDSKGAKIYQTRKPWLDLTTDDVDMAIKWANRKE
ncbi:MAG: undecaprenyl diphosphate synthase family protein [Nanoarchaeota archaeon]|nr:undecaprenyl diphosphate synthase family protein [DPANN group archaeon]MBL7116426.1 undecaprenyl diphosphate synthase family protein [Nanoarchaeota archaeon]